MAKKKAAEALEATRARGRRVYDTLEKTYPDAHCALHHKDAWQLLIATILSAQCTDERVNMVTPHLFKAYPGAAKLGEAGQEDVEAIIRSTGFYRNKAKAIIATSREITQRFGGKVPDRMEDLLSLHGVARKTANVVLGNAFGLSEGVVVDTHIARLSQRLAFTTHTDPVKIERDLMAVFPRQRWTMLAHLLIFHGRQICTARKPQCPVCPVNADCPKIGVAPPQAQGGKLE